MSWVIFLLLLNLLTTVAAITLVYRAVEEVRDEMCYSFKDVKCTTSTIERVLGDRDC